MVILRVTCLSWLLVLDVCRLYETSPRVSVLISYFCYTKTAPLVDLIVRQEPEHPLDVYRKQLELKTNSSKSYLSNLISRVKIPDDSLSDGTKRTVELACQKGSSQWWTASPMIRHGVMIH